MTDATLTSKTGVKRYTMRAATGQAGATIIESIEHPYGPWVPYGAYELAQRQFDELTAHCNALRDEKADIVRQLDEARPVHETPAPPARHQWVHSPRGWDCHGCGSFAASTSGRDFIDLDYPCRPALKANERPVCDGCGVTADQPHRDECTSKNGEAKP